MCGGEIVDEKWKLSMEGALTSTVACTGIYPESSSMIPRSRVIAIDWFSLEDLSLSPSASLRPRLEGRGAYGWPPQQPHNAVPLLPVFCFPPAHDQAMEMCKGLFASQILRSFGH